MSRMKYLIPLLFISAPLFGQQGVYYFTPIFGHLHKTANKYSSSITTLSCGHPLRMLSKKGDEDWSYVQVAEFQGYVPTHFVSSKRPACFQARYPRFFNAFDFELNDLYFWGKLYDHYVTGESRFK